MNDLLVIRSLYHLETIWFKDDVAIENSGISHTFNDLWNRTLSLLNADTTHTGRYSCHVSTKSPRSAPVIAAANVTILGNLYTRIYFSIVIEIDSFRFFHPIFYTNSNYMCWPLFEFCL